MKTEVIDIHTHAFADALAPRAMAKLEAAAGTRACLDGRVSSLAASMTAAGIDRAVVLSIATRPEQFEAIMRWSAEIQSSRIIPFPSLHPADPAAVDHVRRIRAAGFRGVKLHPYYQDFTLDAPSMRPIYAAISDCGLALICHTGFDQAFPRDDRAAPRRIMNVIRDFPDLKFIATHCGAWCDWEEVRRHMLGRPVWIEIAYSLEFMDAASARDLLMRHPAEYLLFGTDSPWGSQAGALAQLRALNLGVERETLILGGNAARLLAD